MAGPIEWIPLVLMEVRLSWQIGPLAGQMLWMVKPPMQPQPHLSPLEVIHSVVAYLMYPPRFPVQPQLTLQ